MRPTLLPLAVLLTACAGGATSAGSAPAPAPAAPAPAAVTVMQQAARAEAPKVKDIDPTGNYAVSLSYGGQPLNATLQFGKRSDGTLGGALTVDQVPQPIPLNTVAVTGKRVQATLNSPDGSEVSLDLTIEGENVSGNWKASSGDGSPVSGKKLP